MSYGAVYAWLAIPEASVVVGLLAAWQGDWFWENTVKWFIWW
jgi:hypothetical protein